ncbi:MAG TPA: fumarate hydratase, partial [Clostridiaceae bacterium]|nr:fumarate hydratase [Clostridiaceae bacterium]
MNRDRIIELVSETLVRAGSTFSKDKVLAYKRAIEQESYPQSRWVLEQTLKNAEAAEKNCSPLCDDTGIPHLVLDMGRNKSLTTDMLQAIHLGVQEGLRKL